MKRLLLALCLTVCWLPSAALADRYRVDLIVFLDQSGTAGEATVPAQALRLAGAIDPNHAAGLARAGINVLPDSAFGLETEWQRLRNSKRFQPVLRLAWTQQNPPSERGPSLRLRWGDPLAHTTADGAQVASPVDGSVALLLGRYLHLDVDMAYATLRRDGGLGFYRLKERRRMRRDELHHLDSPRMGVLAKVRRAD